MHSYLTMDPELPVLLMGKFLDNASNGGTLITARNEVGANNIFSSVCQEFCSQGGVPGQVPHPRAGTPPSVPVHPQAGTPPWAGTPPIGQ